MRYPNARKGIKKLFAAEILQVIAVIFNTVCTAFFAVMSIVAEDQNKTVIGLIGIGLLFFTLVAAVLVIIAMLVNMVGVIQTAKDEPAFKVIIYVIIVGVVGTVSIAIADVIIPEDSGALSNFIQVITDMVNAVTTILIIQGITNIAAALGNENVCKKGQTLFHLIIWIVLINISMRAVILCIPANAAVGAEIVLMAAAAILSIVQYFVYLSFLRRASKMLNEQ